MGTKNTTLYPHFGTKNTTICPHFGHNINSPQKIGSVTFICLLDPSFIQKKWKKKMHQSWENNVQGTRWTDRQTWIIGLFNRTRGQQAFSKLNLANNQDFYDYIFTEFHFTTLDKQVKVFWKYRIKLND